jgi:hypothetical protein
MRVGVARPRSFALASLLMVPFLACDRSPSAGSPGDAASAQGLEASHPPPRPTAAHANPPQRVVGAPCKAASLVGSVTVVPLAGGALDGGGTPLVVSGSVPEDAWIDIGKSSRLTARDALSTRETTYSGPGRFRVCIGNREEAWIERGLFESVGGAGERPGGEEWVATPLGAGRYDAAKWTLTVTDKAVEVRVSTGTGYFWPAEGVATHFFAEAGAPPELNDQGWVRINGGAGATLTVSALVLTKEGAEAALDRCTSGANDAKRLAANLGEADAALGDLAPRHLIARRLAHAACSVAYLRIESLPASPARDGYLERVRVADADWKVLSPPPPFETPF